MRASLPEDTLETLRRRPEAALTTDRTARTRVGYDVQVRIMMDELIAQEFMPMDGRDNREPLTTAVTEE